MLKTHIIYKGRKPDASELYEVFPLLEVTWESYASYIKTVKDPIYKIYTLDFNWLRLLFKGKDIDVRCLVLEPNDLKGIGITDHWGFYSLDNDMTHDFYMTTLKSDPRAKANGFKTTFAWMFCHEYLHGAVWEESKDRETAASLVHQWEAQGLLKVKLQEFIKRHNALTVKVSLLEQVYALLSNWNKKKVIITPTKLLPLIERRAADIIIEMRKRGHEVRLVEGFRSLERQTELYNQGRTTPGAIVTNAKAGESSHNYGVAVDFVFRKEGYNASSSLWELLGKVGRAQGFEWGGDWKGFVDKPHFEMRLGYSLKDFQAGKVDYKKFN